VDLPRRRETGIAAHERGRGSQRIPLVRLGTSPPRQAEGRLGALAAGAHSLQEPDKVAVYLVFAPEGTLFETMVAVAGPHGTVEESLELGNGEVGLDQYEVRHWVNWYRHFTLSMLALAYLVVVRTRARNEAKKGGSEHCSLASNSSRSAAPGLSSRVADAHSS
jgi:hypothetical protein